jgi:hypothetical protein
MKKTLVFDEHTLQYGYPLTTSNGTFLDPPLRRYRTVERYQLVVPFNASCNAVCSDLSEPSFRSR